MTSLDNLTASIHQKILNKAQQENRPFNDLLQLYAIERFLYRLGKSEYQQKFILKGALAFLAWDIPLSRPTRDMDFLGYTNNSIINLSEIFGEICNQKVEPDGMKFDSESIQSEAIIQDSDYQGVRITFQGSLGKAKARMQIDIGFNDSLSSVPTECNLPTILEDMKHPNIRVYPLQAVIAEKFQIMVSLGMINSRLKDFYDLWFLISSKSFSLETVSLAIAQTFQHRKTSLPKQTPTAFTEDFATTKQSQWSAFLIRNNLENAPAEFIQITKVLEVFFTPIIYQKNFKDAVWSPDLLTWKT